MESVPTWANGVQKRNYLGTLAAILGSKFRSLGVCQACSGNLSVGPMIILKLMLLLFLDDARSGADLLRIAFTSVELSLGLGLRAGG